MYVGRQRPGYYYQCDRKIGPSRQEWQVGVATPSRLQSRVNKKLGHFAPNTAQFTSY